MPGELRELSLEDMLADPIVQLVMRRDGLIAADVRLIMSVARAARRPCEADLGLTPQSAAAQAPLLTA
jgi:hypothetical protein